MTVKRIICIAVSLLLIVGLFSACTSEGKDVFSVSDTRHQIDDTAVCDDTDFFEGLYMDMPYDEYIAIATEKYGADAIEIYESLSYDTEGIPVDGYTWKAVHTRLYDESKDINSWVSIYFRNDELQMMEAESFVYCTSESNFKERAEILIAEHDGFLDNMLSDKDRWRESRQYTKWEYRYYEEMGVGEEKLYNEFDEEIPVASFHITITLPDKISENDYNIFPYDKGEAGVIHYSYIKTNNAMDPKGFFRITGSGLENRRF